MKPILLLLILFLSPVTLIYADTFVVISNAERGAGTLADALQKAAANGTTVRDHIAFSLSGSTSDDHTILITQPLPDITGNVEIDGTTQPGSTFGVSDAKVCVRWKEYQPVKFTFLKFVYANNVSIFGMMLYQPYWNGDGLSEIRAIDFSGSNHTVIGAPGKGNYISGFSSSISTYYDSAGLNVEHGISVDLLIQSNIIGLNPAGNPDIVYNGSYYFDAMQAIRLFDTKDVLIGGDDEKEGNYIFAFKALSYTNRSATNNGFLKIKNNKINTDITGNIDRGGSSSTQFTSLKITGGYIFQNRRICLLR